MKSLKIENSFYLKAVSKIAPWFPAAVRAWRDHVKDCQ